MKTRADKVYSFLYWFVDVVWSLALILGTLLILAVLIGILVTIVLHPSTTLQEVLNVLFH